MYYAFPFSEASLLKPILAKEEAFTGLTPGSGCAPPHERDGRVVKGVNSNAPVLSPVVDVDVAVLPADAEHRMDRVPL